MLMGPFWYPFMVRTLFTFGVLFVAANTLNAQPLPNTTPITAEGDLARAMVDGMHAYLDRELKAAPEQRVKKWNVDASSPEAYARSIAPNRERLRKSLGVADARVPPNLEYNSSPGMIAKLGESDRFQVFAVRWAVLPGIDAEGLLLEPRGTAPIMSAVAIPDAGHSPEQIAGLAPGVPEEAQFARRLAENHVRVLVPVLINREDTYSANARLNRATNQPHREFIHRMAFQMGRTMIGYEVQKVLAAVDWLHEQGPKSPGDRIGVMGHGEGGRLALYAGAIDDRIHVTHVNGAFGPQESLHSQPIYRNVWGLLTEFGDAEIAAFCYSPLLRAPGSDISKSLIVDNNAVPTVTGPPAPRPGRAGAAPGVIAPPNTDAARQELHSSHDLALKTGASGDLAYSLNMSTEKTLPVRVPVEMQAFLGRKAVDDPPRQPLTAITLTREVPKPETRQKRQFDQLVAYTQKLWRDSDAVRKDFWKKADASSPEKWEQSCDWYRDYFHTEVIGKLPDPTMPLNPRTRPLYDEPRWTGYEVTLDVYPDVFAYGVLLLPKDLKPGERRPVVVCQHGLEGRPTDVTNPKEKTRAYNSYGARLADLGYIVYAPQNPYIFENDFRQLQRKANPLKLSLFSFIIRQHERSIDWLETLPQVDPKRIAFYGLSYGGKTAMRVPAVEKRYCLSICSGDFNEWIGKNVSVDLDRSYMWTREYEMYEFDLGNTFNYAEMAYLIAPRPFMVERGHDDGVGTDEMVAYEFAKVRYLYANRLKIPNNTTIEYFPGGHEIRAQGTFQFLKDHLGYPK